MALNPFSPLSPARVNVLLVPAGKISPDKFTTLVSAIRCYGRVALADVPATEQSSKGLFSPNVFPAGQMFFEYSLSINPQSVDAFPFELNRTPQVVLALANGIESSERSNTNSTESPSIFEDEAFKFLLNSFNESVDHYEQALVHQLVVFEELSDRVTWVAGTGQNNNGTLKEMIASIAASLLLGFDDLAKEYDGQSIPSPHFKSKSSGNSRRSINRKSMSLLSRAAFNASNRSPSPAVTNSSEKQPESGFDQSSRTSSRNRFSLASPKNASPNEDPADDSQARYQILLGAMYLQTGRWPDAMRELSDGAASTRSNVVDTAWYAKSLESLLDCMVMFAWAQLDFNIPQICYSATDKLPGPRSRLTSVNQGEAQNSGESSVASLQTLAKVIPGLANTILTLYANVSSTAQEQIPQIMISETRVRLAGLLVVMSRRGGTLDRLALTNLVTGAPLETASSDQLGTAVLSISKYEIATMLADAAEELPNDVSAKVLIDVLIAVTSEFSNLGLERRHAFYLKTLLQRLIPGLVDARKTGAAELGIHPAAALSLQGGAPRGIGPSVNGVRTVLRLAGEAYGLPLIKMNMQTSAVTSPDLESIEIEATQWTQNQTAGDLSIKLEILRICAGVCEALPDVEAGLQYNTQLLRCAKRAITISQTSKADPPWISQDEQMRLLNNIKRTVGAATKLGLPTLRAWYWDDFLVRGIDLIEYETKDRLTPHTAQELSLVVGGSRDAPKDPFIYNPFSKPKKANGQDVILLADETAYFSVLLQNPLQFDVEIDNISLVTEGCEFEAASHNIVLGHFCSQRFVLSGRPKSEGSLKILGCRARIKDCHEQTFLTLPKQWAATSSLKQRRMFKPSTNMRGNTLRPSEGQAEMKALKREATTLETASLMLQVIQAQPTISVQGTSLTQSALMLLEGETRQLQITLRNESQKVAADLLLFTFDDSVTKQVQEALTNKDLSPAELYELHLQLSEKPAVRWIFEDEQQQSASIEAGESRSFTFEVLGKPGLLDATIQVDYAALGRPRSEVKDKFYTRQIRVPITITVNGSVEIPRCNILPFFGHESPMNAASVNRNGDLSKTAPESVQVSENLEHSDEDGCCLVLVDLRNVWPHPISVTLQSRSDRIPERDREDKLRYINSAKETLQPGHVSRSVLLIPRAYVVEPHSPIPTIGSQRQFVVSASKVSIEAEAANREAFWYREELLKNISGHWKEEDTGRSGTIDFRRGIRLNARMMEALKLEDVEMKFSMQLLASNSLSAEFGKTLVKSAGHLSFTLPVNTFAKARLQIHNRSQQKLHLLLRLQPSLCNQPHTVALDLSKRFAWSGMLQRALNPAVEPGEIREAELGVTALAEGQYEISATVEEIKASKIDLIPEGIGATGGVIERRIWHAREPCMIDAVPNVIAITASSI